MATRIQLVQIPHYIWHAVCTNYKLNAGVPGYTSSLDVTTGELFRLVKGGLAMTTPSSSSGILRSQWCWSSAVDKRKSPLSSLFPKHTFPFHEVKWWVDISHLIQFSTKQCIKIALTFLTGRKLSFQHRHIHILPKIIIRFSSLKI